MTARVLGRARMLVLGFVRWLLTSKTPALAFFFSTLACFTVYRVRLANYLFASSHGGAAPVEGFIPEQASRIDYAAGIAYDVAVAAIVAAIVFVVWVPLPILRSLASRPTVRLFTRLFALLVAVALLACVAVAHALQFGLITQLQGVPTRGLLAYSLANSSPLDYLPYVSIADVGFMALPFVLGVVYMTLRPRWSAVLRTPFVGLTVLAVPLFAWQRMEPDIGQYAASATPGARQPQIQAPRSPIDAGISENPIWWAYWEWTRISPKRLDSLAEDVRRRLAVEVADSGRTFSEGVAPTVQRVDPRSVILVQLESVGYRHVFGGPNEPSLMPFLRSLAQKSFVSPLHFTTGVDTDTASFSIYTGLFPPPQPVPFVSRKDLRVPTLFTYLPLGYKSSLVTPADTRFWFPAALLRNTGLQALWDSENLNVETHAVGVGAVLDERATYEFFAREWARTKAPFAMVYGPYATHGPYLIQCESDRSAVEEESNRARFAVNARLVDGLVKRIVDSMKERESCNCVLIVTADHGEGFGEHPETTGHGLTLFNETVHVPLLIYAPGLVVPQEYSGVSSHVDLLPTILDILSIPYDPRSFDGVSLLRGHERLYSFFYSPKTDRLGSISHEDRRKVVIDFRNDVCRSYNLRIDWSEATPGQCNEQGEQFRSLLRFRAVGMQELLVRQSRAAAI